MYYTSARVCESCVDKCGAIGVLISVAWDVSGGF